MPQLSADAQRTVADLRVLAALTSDRRRAQRLVSLIARDR